MTGVYSICSTSVREARRPPSTFRTRLGWTSEKHYESGDVVDAILRIAEKNHAELIVMTTTGRDGILDRLRGTMTEQVVRGANCPVLAIPEG